MGGITHPKLYLFKSLKRQIFDNFNKEGKFPSVGIDEIPFDIEYRLYSDESARDSKKEEQLEKFNAALSLMTPRQKEAIYLHYTQGLSYEEIAVLMDMNLQSLRNLVSRAFSRIRKIFSE